MNPRRPSYDIADDPRYDATPSALTVVVSRCPTVIPFGRKKMLKLLGLPMSATWGEANPILKERIVAARQANDEGAASRWSTIRDQLEKKLARHCGCGELIRAGGIYCRSCNAERAARGNRKSHEFLKETSFRHHLGRYSDTKIGKMYGLSEFAVGRYRRKLGIRAFDCPGFEPHVQPRRNWPQSVISRLGAMPDRTLARMFNLNRMSVVRERQRRGIPIFRSRRKQHYLSRATIKLLGTETDVELAKRDGVTRSTVTRARRKRGIPSFRSKTH